MICTVCIWDPLWLDDTCYSIRIFEDVSWEMNFEVKNEFETFDVIGLNYRKFYYIVELIFEMEILKCRKQNIETFSVI